MNSEHDCHDKALVAPAEGELHPMVVEAVSRRSKDSSKENAETWWVNPATWLPVRTLAINSAVSIQVDYGFLPPTPANIAKLKVTIPPGFTRAPTIK